MKYIILFSVFLLTLLNILNAQVCSYPSLASPMFNCNKEYQPVCGCDGITYRNVCNAQYQNGVFYWSDGPCNGISFDIIPNFISDQDPQMEFTFAQNKGIPATLYIFDNFGKVIHQQALPAADNFNPPYYQIFFNLSSYRQGVYIISITNANGDYIWKKFVKY